MLSGVLTTREHALPGYIPPHKRDRRRAESYLKQIENRQKEKAALEQQLEANRLKRKEFWAQHGSKAGCSASTVTRPGRNGTRPVRPSTGSGRN